jgi:small subunit ribosomal protein S6
LSAEYELILMLDPEVPDERREEIAGNAKQRIESAGSLRHSDSWGMRKLAYEIEQRNEADYRFYRFEAEPPLLGDLDHTLKITDGILRFRLFKVDPRAPLIEPPAGLQLGASREGRGGGRREDRGPRREQAPSAESTPSAPEAPVAPETPEQPADPTPEQPEPGPSEPAEEPAPEPQPAERYTPLLTASASSPPPGGRDRAAPRLIIGDAYIDREGQSKWQPRTSTPSSSRAT